MKAFLCMLAIVPLAGCDWFQSPDRPVTVASHYFEDIDPPALPAKVNPRPANHDQRMEKIEAALELQGEILKDLAAKSGSSSPPLVPVPPRSTHSATPAKSMSLYDRVDRSPIRQGRYGRYRGIIVWGDLGVNEIGEPNCKPCTGLYRKALSRGRTLGYSVGKTSAADIWFRRPTQEMAADMKQNGEPLIEFVKDGEPYLRKRGYRENSDDWQRIINHHPEASDKPAPRDGSRFLKAVSYGIPREGDYAPPAPATVPISAAESAPAPLPAKSQLVETDGDWQPPPEPVDPAPAACSRPAARSVTSSNCSGGYDYSREWAALGRPGYSSNCSGSYSASSSNCSGGYSYSAPVYVYAAPPAPVQTYTYYASPMASNCSGSYSSFGSPMASNCSGGGGGFQGFQGYSSGYSQAYQPMASYGGGYGYGGGGHYCDPRTGICY